MTDVVSSSQAAVPEEEKKFFSDKYMLIIHLLIDVFCLLPLFLPVPNVVQIVGLSTVCVLVGAIRSVKPQPPEDSMTTTDALKFPVVGSAMLLGLFVAVKYLPANLLTLVINGYCWVLGVVTSASMFHPIMKIFFGDSMDTMIIDRRGKVTMYIDDLYVTVGHLYGGIIGIALSTWYVLDKFWLTNNALGIIFTITSIEHLGLGSVKAGVILLLLLFVYDVFWVFFTPVMVTVARKVDGPLKLLFTPKAFLFTPGPFKYNALGLGDMVLPGLFIALMLRYDLKHTGNTSYFQTSMVGYVLGMAGTMTAMYVFNAAQPALLYLVPGVLGCTFLHALVNGQFMDVFNFEEQSDLAIQSKRDKASNGETKKEQ